MLWRMQQSKSAPRLVVGVDGGGHADHAVRVAFLLARSLSGEVELVHVPEIPHPIWEHVPPEVVDQARSRTVERLAALLADLGIPSGELDRRLVVERGSPARVLLERGRGAAWILLGAHSRSGRFDFGNNVRAVLSHAPCPVWVQPGPFTGVARVTAALDLSAASRQVMEVARDVALGHSAALELLHVFVRPDLGYVLGYPVPFPPSVVERARNTAEQELDRLSKAVDWAGRQPAVRFVEGDPVSEILAAQETADLLVLGAHGHSALLEALLGNVVRRVLAAARRPVAVVRAESG